MLLSIALLVCGFALLIFSANWLVDGATALAKKYNVSDLAVGLTVVAFGTSAPELVVNVTAAVNDHTEIVFGNILGSNNVNLFLILGVAGLIAPLSVKSSTVWKEIPVSLVAAITVFFMANDFFSDGTPGLSRVDGIILLVGFGFFLFYVFKTLKNDPAAPAIEVVPRSNFAVAGLIIIGLAGLIGGGKLTVTHAVALAEQWGMSEKLIGLTVVAIGTSLPELATSVVAALKKNTDIAVGNIIGSNIFNLLLILAMSAVVQPLGYNTAFNTDLYLLGAGTVFLFIAMFTLKNHKLDRREAGVLLAVFVGDMVYLVRFS